MCMPGDNVTMNIELITPIAIEEGLRFAIREGGHTVGAGVVTAIEVNLTFYAHRSDALSTIHAALRAAANAALVLCF